MRETEKETPPEASVEEYHEVFGGRLPRDLRFAEENNAPNIRGLAVDIKRLNGISLTDMAESLGVSGSTLSKAALGRAGVKVEEDGMSTTERVYNGLRELHETHSSDQI